VRRWPVALGARIQRTLFTLVLCGLSPACHRAADDTAPADGGPILVFFVPDTLGKAAADGADWCGQLSTAVGKYGLDVACLEGGVSPSDYTAESHTRFLWPQHLGPPLRANYKPECGTLPVTDTLAEAWNARYIFAADNTTLGNTERDACPGGYLNNWHQGADEVYARVPTETPGLEAGPDAPHPMDDGIAAAVMAIGQNESVSLFLNAFEPGGHQPRCWFDPYSPACEQLWQWAVEMHVVESNANRADEWIDDLWSKLDSQLSVLRVDDEPIIRALMWETILDAIAYHSPPLFEDRLDRLLVAAEEAGRLDDVALVVLADHGESPCVYKTFGEGLECSHGRMGNEWNNIVPAYVVPASMADAWQGRFVGDRDVAWNTANIAWALLDTFGVPVPADWPAMQPVGEATTWRCRPKDGDTTGMGIHVEGHASIRCEDGDCVVQSWDTPQSITYSPTTLTEYPDNFAEYSGDGSGTWFQAACADTTEDP
jgi:hypothetical protein